MALTLATLDSAEGLKTPPATIKTWVNIPADKGAPIRATKIKLEQRLSDGVTFTLLMSLACSALSKELDNNPSLNERALFDHLRNLGK